ncbi:MAG: hydantoinase B/oxoprolinase family protein [Candidatus Methylomirabilales bacterium]
MTAPAIAPTLLAEVRQQLIESAAAMDAALRQGAMSVGMARQGGTAAAVHTAAGALIVGGRESHPLLLESASEAVATFLAHAGAGASLGGDDVFATNDPRETGAGLEDLVLVAPVAWEEEVPFLVTLTGSHAALGRATLAPVSRLRREGVLLPWTRLGRRGALQAEIAGLLAANTDAPDAFRQDLAAHLHALEVGRTALEGLLERLGAEPLRLACETLSRACRAPLARLLAALKGAAGRGVVPPFAVRVGADGEAADVSLAREGGSPVLPGCARAAVRAALRQILAVEAPAAGLQGDLREVVRVDTSDNDEDAPAGEARFAGAQGVAAAVLAAFAEHVPHLTHAPDAGALLVDLRGERADGRRYRLRLGLPGGAGASVYGDGLTAAGPAFSPYRTLSVEEIERRFPVRIHRLEMLPDAGGPGQYRGGLGSRLELRLLEGRAQADVLLPGRAAGLRGGMRGSVGRLVVQAAETGRRETDGGILETVQLVAGTVLILESPGGGGWGMPFQRSIMRLEDSALGSRRSVASCPRD